MEFAFTQEQEMIRDTAAGFLAGVSDSEAVRLAMATESGYQPELWQRICSDMFWQAMLVPEKYGGMGLGYVELVATMEQMGRYLLCSPFFSTVCLAGNALLVSGSEEQQAHWLGKLCLGGAHRPEALHRHWCHSVNQRRDMGAPARSSEQLGDVFSESASNRQTDQLLIVRCDRWTPILRM